MKIKEKAKSKDDSLKQLVSRFRAWLAGVDRKVLIQNGVILGAFLVFIVFFFFPILGRNRAAAGEVAQLKGQIYNAGALIARLPEMKKQKEIFGARIEKIRKGFFKSSEASQLIEIISAAANQSKVRISATQPGAKEVTLPDPFQQIYRVASYELTVDGGYHGLGTFTNRLEQYSKNFAVPELKMTRNKETPGAHKAVLVVHAFFERYVRGTK